MVEDGREGAEAAEDDESGGGLSSQTTKTKRARAEKSGRPCAEY